MPFVDWDPDQGNNIWFKPPTANSPGIGTQTPPPGAGGPPVAAPTPPPAPPKPDFDADPGVVMAKGLEQQGLSQIDAWLKAARERALVAWGDPNLASMAGFDVDPNTRSMAEQNMLSGNAQLSRLNKERDLKRRQIANALAGRGIIYSGDLGYLSGEAGQEHGNKVYDAQQALLTMLSEYLAKYNEQKNSLRQGVLEAYMNAYNRYGASG